MSIFDQTTLKCFIAVAESKSFTKASEIIFKTQSAVSQQISKLEQYFDKKLFFRDKIILLTKDGEVFYEYAKQIYQLQAQASNYFKHSKIQGEVKFGLPEDFITIFLDDVLNDFKIIHPDININIECDLSLNLLNRFAQDEFDMILFKMDDAKIIDKSQEIWSEKLEWVVSKSLAQSIQELKTIPLILSPQPCLYRSRAIQALQASNLNYNIVFTSSSYNSKIAAIRAGLGISVIPKSMIPKDLKILKNNSLPKMDDTHVGLIQKDSENIVIASFTDFIMQKLHQ
jgi:DNA-binding transcriptional LysR family regulator